MWLGLAACRAKRDVFASVVDRQAAIDRFAADWHHA